MVTIKDVVNAYILMKTPQLALKSIKCYEDRLRCLLDGFGDLPANCIGESLLKSLVSGQTNAKTGQPSSSDTNRANISAAKKVAKFAFEHGYVSHPIPMDIRLPAATWRDRLATRKEQAAILRIAPVLFRRIYQALRLSGARPHELADAMIENYDRQHGVIRLGGHKTIRATGRNRKIPVGKRLARILGHAIGDRKSGPIFLTSRGGKWNNETLSHKFHRLRLKAGITDNLCLYAATRHDHATRVAEKYGVFAAASSLGHATMDTIFRYTHLSDEKLAEYQDNL